MHLLDRYFMWIYEVGVGEDLIVILSVVIRKQQKKIRCVIKFHKFYVK